MPPPRPHREGVIKPSTPFFRLLVDEAGLTDALLEFVVNPRATRNDLPVIQDLHDLGFDELVDDGVTVVEWGDLVEQAVPAEHLIVRISPGDADTERVLDLSFHGARWRGRRPAIEQALTAPVAG